MKMQEDLTNSSCTAASTMASEREEEGTLNRLVLLTERISLREELVRDREARVAVKEVDAMKQETELLKKESEAVELLDEAAKKMSEAETRIQEVKAMELKTANLKNKSQKKMSKDYLMPAILGAWNLFLGLLVVYHYALDGGHQQQQTEKMHVWVRRQPASCRFEPLAAANATLNVNFSSQGGTRSNSTTAGVMPAEQVDGMSGINRSQEAFDENGFAVLNWTLDDQPAHVLYSLLNMCQHQVENLINEMAEGEIERSKTRVLVEELGSSTILHYAAKIHENATIVERKNGFNVFFQASDTSSSEKRGTDLLLWYDIPVAGVSKVSVQLGHVLVTQGRFSVGIVHPKDPSKLGGTGFWINRKQFSSSGRQHDDHYSSSQRSPLGYYTDVTIEADVSSKHELVRFFIVITAEDRDHGANFDVLQADFTKLRLRVDHN